MKRRRKRRFRRVRYYTRARRAALRRLDGHQVYGHYVLDKRGAPVPCHSLGKWARAHRSKKRFLASATVGRLWVSTVFLGIDMDFRNSMRPEELRIPILFESMVFDRAAEHPNEGLRQLRYATRAEALEGHARLVEWARERLN